MINTDSLATLHLEVFALLRKWREGNPKAPPVMTDEECEAFERDSNVESDEPSDRLL